MSKITEYTLNEFQHEFNDDVHYYNSRYNGSIIKIYLMNTFKYCNCDTVRLKDKCCFHSMNYIYKGIIESDT